jgi:hypothetical protein
MNKSFTSSMFSPLDIQSQDFILDVFSLASNYENLGPVMSFAKTH